MLVQGLISVLLGIGLGGPLAQIEIGTPEVETPATVPKEVPIQAETPPKESKSQEVDPPESVEDVVEHLEMIDYLVSVGQINPSLAGELEHYLIGVASKIAGEQLTRDTLDTWSQREGIGLIGLIFSVLGGLLVVIAITYLFGPVIELIIMYVPRELWEFLLYALSLSLLFVPGHYLISGYLFLWIIGAFGFAATLKLSFHLHGVTSGSDRFNWSVISGLCAFVWGAAAVVHHDAWLGFMSVIALESLLGFSVAVSPLCYCVGFRDDDSMVRTTFASLVLLALGLGMRLLGFADSTPVLEVFESGLLFMGSFVGFLGLLIISCRWYLEYRSEHLNMAHYIFLNLLMLGLMVLSIYLGEATDVSILRGMAVAFLVLWVLDKTAELTYAIQSVSIGLLLGGLALGGAGWFCLKYTHLLVFSLT